ncbi:hypothetical protein NMY22_g12215 [Coprinellus aureogranulatus]|nr:hypothetical protein NMY22_g12215 [Coprinellus aureogranulatus]
MRVRCREGGMFDLLVAPSLSRFFSNQGGMAPKEEKAPASTTVVSVSDEKLSKTSSSSPSIASPLSPNEKTKDNTLVDDEPTPFRWTNYLLRRPVQKYDADAIATRRSVYDDPALAQYYWPKEMYENRHRFDPGARWTYREERRLVRKIDWKVMLWAAVSFSALNLDRGNLSQANTDNFLPDLKMTTNDFNLGNTVFRLAFLSAELPSQLVSKRLGPDVWIPIQICGWSLVTAAQFFLNGRTSFLVCRALLGFLQGGFIPDLILYMSLYSRASSRLGFSVCEVYSGELGGGGFSLLSAFLSLLHYSECTNTSPCIRRGGITLLIGIATFFRMPPSPTQTKTWFRPKGWFTDREEVIAVSRILRDDPSKGDMHNREALTPKLLWKAIGDYDLWPLYVIGLLFGIPASPPAQYLTLSLRNLGFNTFQTNLLTIPSAVGTMITMYAIAVISESVNDRAIVSMMEDVWCLPFLIALRALPDQPNPWIFYGLATGLLVFPSTHPIQVGWCSRNAGGVASRTVNASLYNMFVQASGIISANIYRKDDAPMYRRGNSWLLGICAFNCFILYPGVKVYYVWRNKQKARVWDGMTNEASSSIISMRNSILDSEGVVTRLDCSLKFVSRAHPTLSTSHHLRGVGKLLHHARSPNWKSAMEGTRKVKPEAVFKRVTAHPRECANLMRSLLKKSTPSRTVYNYVVALKERFRVHGELIQQEGRTRGFDKFEKLAIGSGMIETLFQLARRAETEMEKVFTTYFAAEALWKLIVIGTPSEKKELLEKYIEHDVVEFCHERARNAAFIAHRVIAMIGLRALSQECYLADYLSLEKTSEIMKTCCECVLLGPDLFVQQLGDPEITWQSLFCFGNIHASAKKAGRYAPRYYATYQENAIWIVRELVSRQPFPGQDYYNSLVKHDPSVLELLLRCCDVPREAHYAQLEVDSNALTVLVLLMHLPVEMVPGLKIKVSNEAIQGRLEERWEAVMQGAGLLVACPGWCKSLVDVYERLESEDVVELYDMLKSARKSFHAILPYDDEELIKVFTYRGIAKVSLLRMIATISFASERFDEILNEDLLNLLPITQAACQTELNEESDPEDADVTGAYEESHQYSFAQAGIEEFHGPSDCEEIVQINEMVIEGPTTHIRLLVSLAKRGVLEEVAQWKKLPAGVSLHGGLSKLQGYLSEYEIMRCLSVSLDALAKRRERGNTTFRDDKNVNEARFEYWSAAMLGAALLEFDEVTKGKYSNALSGVKKELALSLGNAAEMSLNLQYFDRALVFASAAVKVAERCSGEDRVDQKVREKNERRVKRAEEGISRKRTKFLVPIMPRANAHNGPRRRRRNDGGLRTPIQIPRRVRFPTVCIFVFDYVSYNSLSISFVSKQRRELRILMVASRWECDELTVATWTALKRKTNMIGRRSRHAPGEFARLMSSLVDPNAPSKAVYNYVITLKDRFLRRGGLIRLGGKTPGFDDFEKLAIQSGIVETLFKIARGTGKTMEEVFTTYFAAEALWKLIVIGSPSEKKDLLKKYMEHHVVEYCVENAQGGAFIAHRVIGMLGLRILSQECYLADHLSVEKTSEVMKTCCECMLLGPDLFVRQLRDPATTWQSLFCFGNTEVNPKKAARHAPRYYATFQENAIWTIYEFVSRLPFPGQDYYNNLMKHDPALLDLLLRCCNVPREAHYAESEVDSSALTVLVLIMHLPVEMVPGLKIEVPVQSVKDRLERRWDGVMEAAGLIATHSKWRQHFVDVWQRLESEKVDEISRMMMEAQKKYHAQFPFEEEALDLVIQYRGKYSIAKVSLIAGRPISAIVLTTFDLSPDSVHNLMQGSTEVRRLDAVIESPLLPTLIAIADAMPKIQRVKLLTTYGFWGENPCKSDIESVDKVLQRMQCLTLADIDGAVWMWSKAEEAVIPKIPLPVEEGSLGVFVPMCTDYHMYSGFYSLH